MNTENSKLIYLYPIYLNEDTFQFQDDKKMIAFIHPGADIKWVHFSQTPYQNFYDLIPDESCVIMKSIFDFISIVNKKFCPFVLRYGKQNEIYKHFLENYSDISDYYIWHYKEAAKVYKEAAYKRNIWFMFDETPAFNYDNLLITALKIRTSTTNIDEANENFDIYFDMLINSYLVQRKNEAIKFTRTPCIKSSKNNSSRKSGEYVTYKELNSQFGIINLSKDFNGKMNDTQLMAELKISRNTLKKYKKKLKVQFENQQSLIANKQ